MTLAATLPQTIHLNPLQQWRYFSQPRAMHDWLRERYGGLVSLHFQGRNFAGILTAEGARQVFSADPDNYDAFHCVFPGAAKTLVSIVEMLYSIARQSV